MHQQYGVGAALQYLVARGISTPRFLARLGFVVVRGMFVTFGDVVKLGHEWGSPQHMLAVAYDIICGVYTAIADVVALVTLDDLIGAVVSFWCRYCGRGSICYRFPITKARTRGDNELPDSLGRFSF